MDSKILIGGAQPRRPHSEHHYRRLKENIDSVEARALAPIDPAEWDTPPRTSLEAYPWQDLPTMLLEPLSLLS